MRPATVLGAQDKRILGSAGAPDPEDVPDSLSGGLGPGDRLEAGHGLEPGAGLEPRDGFIGDPVADAGPRGGRVSLSYGFEPGYGNIEGPIAPPALGGCRLGTAISCSPDAADGAVEGRISGLRGGVDEEEPGLIVITFPEASRDELVREDPVFPPARLICAQLAPIGGCWLLRISIASLGSTGLPEDCCLFPLAKQAKGSCGAPFVPSGIEWPFETLSVLPYGC